MSPPKKIRKTVEGGEKKEAPPMEVVARGEKKKLSPGGIIRFEIENVRQMKGCVDKHYPDEIQGGATWGVEVGRKEKSLKARFYCENDQSTPWSIAVDAEFVLVHPDNSKNITIERSSTLHNDRKAIVVRLSKNVEDIEEFIADGKITVEVRFWIKSLWQFGPVIRGGQIDFIDSNDPRHDVALVINGQKIYANKAVLATISHRFHCLFYGELSKADQKEFELKLKNMGIKREEFLEFLQVVYYPDKTISVDSAEYLLALAIRYQMVPMIDRVEKFLIETADIEYAEKLKIANKHSISGLLESCIVGIKKVVDWNQIEGSDLYQELSDHSKAALMPVIHDKFDQRGMKRIQDQVVLFVNNQLSAWSKGTSDRNFICTSNESVVKGVPWEVRISREGDTISASLHCMNSQLAPWSIDVEAEFFLIHPENKKYQVFQESKTFDGTQSCDDGLTTEMLHYNGEELERGDKRYVKDDKVSFEVHFWITKMKGVKTYPRIDFCDPTEPLHDVAFVLDGEKIYANKGILAAKSSYFCALFYGESSDKNKKEIELDVPREEFLEMLNVIYPSCKKITVRSYEYLLKLAKRMKIACLFSRVEEFLMTYEGATGPRIIEKLRLADKYRLPALQEHCISKLTMTNDYKDIVDTQEYKEFSDGMKIALLERLTKNLPSNVQVANSA